MELRIWAWVRARDAGVICAVSRQMPAFGWWQRSWVAGSSLGQAAGAGRQLDGVLQLLREFADRLYALRCTAGAWYLVKLGLVGLCALQCRRVDADSGVWGLSR